jgi:hypothetical protein
MLVGNEVLLSVLCILGKLFWFLFKFFFIESITGSVLASEIETLLGSLPVSEDSATVLYFFFFLEGISSLEVR